MTQRRAITPGAITLLPRPRLLRRISLVLQNCPVCLIAPPGYGKSTLLREYVAQHPGANYIPLRAENVAHVQLEAHLAALPAGTLVALDDVQYLDVQYYDIQNHKGQRHEGQHRQGQNLAGNDEALAVLVDSIATHDLQWLLAGRSLPAPILQASEEVVILGMDDLALTPAETDYLLQSHTVPLEGSERGQWYAHTRGWPLAVSLAQQQSVEAHNSSKPLAQMSASELLAEADPNQLDATATPLALITPLARRLLGELGTALQRFMLISALPQRFNHQLCSHLLGSTRSEAAAWQAEIIRRNLFIYADEQPGWYRYHDLIREFLNLEAERCLGQAAVSRLLVSAANWFYTADELYAAIDHAQLAQDSALAASYLHELEPTLVWDQGLFRTYRRWISTLDTDTQARNPALLIRLGRALLDVGDRAAARSWFDRAHRFAQSAQDRESLWEAQTALAKLHNMQGELSAALALCQGVMDEAPESHPAFLQALNASGNALVQLNRFRAARDCFERALQVLESLPDDPRAPPIPNRAQLAANLHHNLAMGIHGPLGHFEAAQAHLRSNDVYYAERPVARSMHLLAWCGFHEAYGDWAGLAQDLAEIETAEALSEHPDEENIWYFWYKALYHIGVGEYACAQAIIDELRPMMVTDEDVLCLTYAQVWLLRRLERWDVSRETIRTTLNSSLVGPFYRGMLALEWMLIDAQEQIATQGKHKQQGQVQTGERTAARAGIGLQTTGIPHAHPLGEAQPLADAHQDAMEPAPYLPDLLAARATPWLLRLHAHLACVCYAQDTPASHRRSRRHILQVLRKTGQQNTEQKFFLRLLTAREPELGLRFWRLCLTIEPQDWNAHVGTSGPSAATVVEQAMQAISAVAQARNGLSRRAVIASLFDLLEHLFPSVRMHTARLLAQLGDEIAIPELAQQLERESHAEVKAALAQALNVLESAPPPPLQVALLGEFKVTRGDAQNENIQDQEIPKPVDWHRPAVRRLFQYFALHAGQRLSRDRILDDLWPDSAPQAARNTFRTLFSWLRRALDPYLRPKAPARYFTVEGETYCFAPDAVRHLIRSDMAVFEETVRGTLSQARADDLPHLPAEFVRVLESWSPLLPELPYEPWAVPARERVAGLYVEGCLHAAQSLLHLRRDAEAAQWARQVIQVAPWLEEAYHVLMRAHARQGQRSLALRVYGETVAALQRELDVSPSALTEWLAQRLRQGEEI